MAITQPPIPPNTGNPAQLEERADAFFGWFPTFVMDFNADLPLLRGKTWATRGGSANAITLTAGLVSLTVGTQVRWRAVAANTGAATINLDGLGAVACRTITGVALPAGYIRTDVETVATYDGTFWVVDRQIERGSNANGEFARFADGTQICARENLDLTFFSTILFDGTWTFPAAFASVPVLQACPKYVAPQPSGAHFPSLSTPVTFSQSTSSTVIRIYRLSGGTSFGSSDVFPVSVIAFGRWF